MHLAGEDAGHSLTVLRLLNTPGISNMDSESIHSAFACGNMDFESIHGAFTYGLCIHVVSGYETRYRFEYGF